MHGDRPLSRDGVAAVLRQRIRDGGWRPGTSLPTQQELEEEFGVKRTVIRQALGILHREGLLSMGRGAPATVAEAAPSPEAPRAADVELADRLANAFRARHVTIDAFSLTTETLNSALTPARMAVTEQHLSPESLTVRVLLPTPDSRLALPRHVGDTQDAKPLHRLRRLMHTYANALQAELEGLRVRGLIPRVTVEIRSVAITPVHKLYLLNGSEALFGYYRVVQRPVDIEDESVDIYDVLGIDTKLFRSASSGQRDEQETMFVEESLLWFESLWSTIAEPLDLE